MAGNLKILSIESSGSSCGVALSSDDSIIAEYMIHIPNQHERLLAELINRILKDCNLSVKELSAVAISSGPGSFTGLRIGASVAKGLCFDNYPKLISVPTLKALAHYYASLAKQLNINNILVVNHSHKDLFYYQYFDSSANEISHVQASEYQNILTQTNEKIIICGTGSDYFKGENIIRMHNKILPSYINKLAIELYNKKLYTKPEDFEPNYFFDFIPKVKNKL